MSNLIPPYNPLWINHGSWFKKARSILKPQSLDIAEVPGWFLGVGGVLLFGIVIQFVNQQYSGDLIELALLAVMSVGGSIALGLLSDRKRIGVWAWALIVTALPAVYLTVTHNTPLWLGITLLTLITHGWHSLRWSRDSI